MQFQRIDGARGFYEEAAAAAATLRVCVDIFAVSAGYCGLDVVEPLAGSSGGCMFLYPSPEKAGLPQVSAQMSWIPWSIDQYHLQLNGRKIRVFTLRRSPLNFPCLKRRTVQ